MRTTPFWCDYTLLSHLSKELDEPSNSFFNFCRGSQRNCRGGAPPAAILLAALLRCSTQQKYSHLAYSTRNMIRLILSVSIICVCPFRYGLERISSIKNCVDKRRRVKWRRDYLSRGPVLRQFKVATVEENTSWENDDRGEENIYSDEPKRAVVPRRLRDPFWMEEEGEEDESYENKWRRRRILALKTAPELSPLELEDLFETDYLTKKTWIQNPNAAFGVIFKLENVLCEINVVPTFLEAWTEVAEEFNVEAPDAGSISYILNQALRDEVAIERVFRWTQDWGEARKMSLRYSEIVATKFDELEIQPIAGVQAWLQDLNDHNVPCCIVTKIPLNMLDSCLQKLNYSHFFNHQNFVTAEDERDRSHQAFLHASLLLERQPSRCVVVSDSIQDLIGAHEADMRAIALVGTHPAYELQVADLVIRYFADLRLSNVRRLFSDIEFDPTIELELLPEPRRSNTIALLDRPDDPTNQNYDYYQDDSDDERR